jgi:spermidine synthase
MAVSEPLSPRAPEADAPAPARPRRRPPLELLVFTVGISTLGAEIAAARLMAPFFGDSTIVWANTIGVVLVALSVGYWFGGRMADRHPSLRALCGTVLAASVLMALVPFVADPFLSLSVRAFDTYSLGGFAGSLFGVLVLVAVPVLMLGTVSPWAIRLKLHGVDDAGQTAGRMYAISTVGSLLGTFAASLLLIPLLGTQRTFLTFALITALVAALGVRARWALVPVAIAAAMALPVGIVKASDGAGTVIREADTEYQYARVIEYPDGERHLELNEGLAVHSVYRPDSVLTGGVWDGYLIEPFAVSPEPPERIAVLGNGAGTTARAYARYFPDTRIDGVEIDGELHDIGREYFGLRERPQLRLFTEDARPFLRRTDERYDAIFVDAYHQPYIPFYLTTVEFFELARDRLAPGGAVIVNVGHPEQSDALEKVLSATVREVFPHVARDPIEELNTLLVAAETPPSAATLRRAAPTLPADLRPLALAAAARLGPALEGGEVYTDDRAPVEWLIDASIVEEATRGAGD